MHCRIATARGLSSSAAARRLCRLLLCLCAACPAVSVAGAVGMGVGIGFVDADGIDGFEAGADVQLGYEFSGTANWVAGAQLHLFDGPTSRRDVDLEGNMHFRAVELNATARPAQEGFRWIQFRAGVVRAEYLTISEEAEAWGPSLGVGFVVPGQHLQWHLLDYQRMFVDGQGFDSLALSVVLLVR